MREPIYEQIQEFKRQRIAARQKRSGCLFITIFIAMEIAVVAWLVLRK